MRIDSYLQKSLGVSRKEAKKIIKNDQIKVNELKIHDAGFKVESGDNIFLNEEKLEIVDHIYLMMNKPAGVVCSTKDRKDITVLDLIPEPFSSRKGLHSVGRLDKDTTGLLLITDDGKWTHKLISPKSKISKHYRVGLKRSAFETDWSPLENGIELKNEKKMTKPAQYRIISDKCIDLVIHEGKYHQVKRMVAYCGNWVYKLARFQIGDLKLDPNLPEGDSRMLTENELAQIFKIGETYGK